MSLTEVTDTGFENDVLKADGLVMVDFWAPWCGPCRNLMPVVEEVAAEAKNVKIVKMNIDENPETPSRLGVRGIPTLMLFKAGELVDARVGGLPKGDLMAWVESKA